MATAPRDLSSTQLWHESLERSQRRRELGELARKHQSRQKSASLAVTAAMATTPIAPTFKTFGGDGPQRASASHTRILEDRDDGSRILLERGMSSAAVQELQEELKIAEDGIFGPVTERAVKRFQAKHGLPATGKVDVRTWLTLFPDGMVVYDPSGQSAQLAAQAPASALRGLAGTNPGDTIPASAVGGGGGSGVAADGAPETPAQLAAARNLAREGGAPEGAEADGGILPDRDAERGERKQRKRERRGSDHRRSSSRDITEGVTVDRGSGSGSASGGGSRGGSRGGGGGGGGGGGPVGGPINVAPGLGSAQDMIAAMVAAANRIDRAHYSYRWGGGHNPRFSGPYDCSGAVSAVLHAAGLINRPMVSGEFMRWGRPGPGAVTIYANAGHVYMSINGRFFGTSRSNPGGGAGWFNGARRPGFVVVHVPFEAMRFKKARRKVRAKATTRTQTRAATASQEPASSSDGSRDSQSGGASYGSSTSTGSGTQQQPAAEQPPAQTAPASEPAAAPAPAAEPAPAAPAPAAEAPVAPAPAPTPEATAPAPAPAAPAAAPAPEATAPAPAPAAEAPAAEAPAPAAAPEASAPAPAPEAPAAEAPAAPEASAPAAEAPAPEAAAPAESAPAAEAPAATPEPSAPDAAAEATESKDGSETEAGTAAAG